MKEIAAMTTTATVTFTVKVIVTVKWRKRGTGKTTVIKTPKIKYPQKQKYRIAKDIIIAARTVSGKVTSALMVVFMIEKTKVSTNETLKHTEFCVRDK